jgi:hypothetical protein
VHYLAGVEGCSLECAARLSEAFAHFLRACVEMLRAHAPLLAGGARPEQERQEREQLVIKALQACSLDYDVKVS